MSCQSTPALDLPCLLTHSQNSRTLVYQSYRAEPWPQWMKRCLNSVQYWANNKGYDYRLIGDEFFTLNPGWFNQKVGPRLPILSDLARLLYAQDALNQYDRVIWLDADTFIFSPETLTFPDESYLFGRERWIQQDVRKSKRLKVYRSVCNALCLFTKGNPFLPFYIHAIQQIIQQIDPLKIAPQLVGPKLLSALNHAFPLPTTLLVGSASPLLLHDLANGTDIILNRFEAALDQQLCAALNLCGSLINHDSLLNEGVVEKAQDRLLNLQRPLGQFIHPAF